VVFLVDDEQAELIAVLVDVAVGAVVGGDGDRGDVVAAAAEDADRFRELVAEGVGESVACHWFMRSIVGVTTRVPDASVGDGLQPEERLPAARGEYDTPSPIVVDPGVERRLLVVTRFDVERLREIEIGVGPRGVFESVSEAFLQRCLLVSVRPLTGPLEQGLDIDMLAFGTRRRGRPTPP